MSVAPDPHLSQTSLVNPNSHGSIHRGLQVKVPSKSNVDFRESSRREDANLLRRAFSGPTQAAIAEKGSRALGVTDRQIINWLQGVHDMPSWAVKAVKLYIGGVERVAKRIESR